MKDTWPRKLWDPPGRNPVQRRNARAKVAGSVLLALAVLVGLALLLL